jgi:hypothetical protein
MPMTLNETLLAKLAEWRPGAGRKTLNVPDEGAGWAVSLTADRADELGCLTWELTLRRGAPLPGGDAQALRAWADRAAGRARGLLETLKVVEVDGERDEALLRSDTPSSKGEDRFYYEVRLKGAGVADVRRYRGSLAATGKREQIAFALTHEALARLAADLSAEK